MLGPEARKTHARVFQNIPRATRLRKAVNAVVGGVIFLGSWFLPLLGFPWQVSVAVGFFGGVVVSKEAVLKYAQMLPAIGQDVGKAIKAIRAGFKNGNGDAAVR